METINKYEAPFNFGENLRPLFEAMKKDQVIKSVTCCRDENNKDDRTKDFTIENFRAVVYCVDIRRVEPIKRHDLVQINQRGENGELKGFYMSWVISFELS
jgi:hypothetical protein